MATTIFRRFRLNLQNYSRKCLSTAKNQQSRHRIVATVCGCSTGLLFTWYLSRGRSKWWFKTPTIQAKEKESVKDDDDEDDKRPLLSHREKRFLSFASVEFDGNVYMTPQDFLESVTEEIPRPRMSRHKLAKGDIDGMMRHTPDHNRGTTKLFRTIHDRGIISYTEYLFLLCVLTKPHSGFRIAFNMFDTDGNQKVDKKEFMVLMNLFCAHVLALRKTPLIATDRVHHAPANLWQLVGDQWTRERLVNQSNLSDTSPPTSQALERIFSGQGRDTGGEMDGPGVAVDLQEIEAMDLVDTTLLIHFFGQKGDKTLSYNDFYKFMDNLQTEVLELEFSEFSKGMPTISEIEFAKILLRYTKVNKEDYEEYIDRLKQRVQQEVGIQFTVFKQFCQFLNNLDDFTVAMRMYTYADMPVSEEEFQRAVKICTGFELDPGIVHTVFQIFDTDDDGHLSHDEFISIMKDRLHRGFRSHLIHQGAWPAFKNCVKHEMRKP